MKFFSDIENTPENLEKMRSGAVELMESIIALCKEKDVPLHIGMSSFIRCHHFAALSVKMKPEHVQSLLKTAGKDYERYYAEAKDL